LKRSSGGNYTVREENQKSEKRESTIRNNHSKDPEIPRYEDVSIKIPSIKQSLQQSLPQSLTHSLRKSLEKGI